MYWGIFVALAFDHKKQEGDRCEYYIILYNRKKKKQKNKSRCVGGFILYENITCFFFFSSNARFIYKILLKRIVMIISTKWSSLMSQENKVDSLYYQLENRCEQNIKKKT